MQHFGGRESIPSYWFALCWLQLTGTTLLLQVLFVCISGAWGPSTLWFAEGAPSLFQTEIVWSTLRCSNLLSQSPPESSLSVSFVLHLGGTLLCKKMFGTPQFQLDPWVLLWDYIIPTTNLSSLPLFLPPLFPFFLISFHLTFIECQVFTY